MKSILNLFILFFVSIVFAQKNMDTIYGNPKFVKEEIEFLDSGIEKLFRDIDGYGFISFLEPNKLLEIRHRNFFSDYRGTYVNFKKEYNENNLLDTETWYDMDDVIKVKFNYLYDKKKNLVEKKTLYNEKPNITKYTFDYKEKIKSSISYYCDKSDNYSYIIFTHDSIGNRIEVSNFDENGYDKSTYFKYDNYNNLIGKYELTPNASGSKNSEVMDSNNKMANFYHYNYDKNGINLLSTQFGVSKKEISTQYEYQYDKENNLLSEKYYYRSYDSTSYNERRFFYDKLNLKIKEINSSSKDLYRIISREFEYNKSDYIIKLNYKEYGKNYIINYKYKFDRKGNWTKITKIVNGEPLYIWTRKIKYY